MFPASLKAITFVYLRLHVHCRLHFWDNVDFWSIPFVSHLSYKDPTATPFANNHPGIASPSTTGELTIPLSVCSIL